MDLCSRRVPDTLEIPEDADLDLLYAVAERHRSMRSVSFPGGGFGLNRTTV
jgi:hypothetical protein